MSSADHNSVTDRVALLTVQTTSELVDTAPEVQTSTRNLQQHIMIEAPSKSRPSHVAKCLFKPTSGFKPSSQKEALEILGILQASMDMVFPTSSNKFSKEVLKATKSIRQLKQYFKSPFKKKTSANTRHTSPTLSII